MKKDRKRQAKKHLASAVRSHTRRLRPPQAAETEVSPNYPAPIKAKPPNFPKDLVEDQQADELNKVPPVMLVISVLAILFISLIAWFVARMPAK